MDKTTGSSPKSKTLVIIYWISTILVALNLTVGAVCDIIQVPFIREMSLHLGYPLYSTYIFGVWEALGAVALLVPGFPRVKEWAYAGTFFLFTGALPSRLAVHDGIADLIPPLVFTCLTIVSWSSRPASRTLAIFQARVRDSEHPK